MLKPVSKVPCIAMVAAVLTATGFVSDAEAKRFKLKLPKPRDVLRVVVPVVAPGAVTVVNTVQGKPLKETVQQVANAHVQVIVKPQEAVIGLEQQIEDAIKKGLGKEVAKVIEVVQMPQKLQKRLEVQAPLTIAHIIATGQLGDIAGAPLAAAFRQAKDLYAPRATPIPPAVKIWMSGTYDTQLLDHARYVVDNNLGSLPGMINRLKERSGDNHAVVVDNIIVFARAPADDDVWFWGHELQHVVQYRQLGIDGFAARYLKHHKDVEAEADVMGDKALANAEAVRNYLLARGARQAQR